MVASILVQRKDQVLSQVSAQQPLPYWGAALKQRGFVAAQYLLQELCWGDPALSCCNSRQFQSAASVL